MKSNIDLTLNDDFKENKQMDSYFNIKNNKHIKFSMKNFIFNKQNLYLGYNPFTKKNEYPWSNKEYNEDENILTRSLNRNRQQKEENYEWNLCDYCGKEIKSYLTEKINKNYVQLCNNCKTRLSSSYLLNKLK